MQEYRISELLSQAHGLGSTNRPWELTAYNFLIGNI